VNGPCAPAAQSTNSASPFSIAAPRRPVQKAEAGGHEAADVRDGQQRQRNVDPSYSPGGDSVYPI